MECHRKQTKSWAHFYLDYSAEVGVRAYRKEEDVDDDLFCLVSALEQEGLPLFVVGQESC